MNAFVKPALVLGMAGAMALGSMTASEARSGRWVGAGIGLAGAVIAGAAIASSRGHYGHGYYGGYGYAPAYGYGYDSYAYAPAPTYVSPGYVSPSYYGPVYSDQPYPFSDNERYSPHYGGYNSNYTGPLRERQLQGRDY